MVTVIGTPSPSTQLIGFKPIAIQALPQYVYTAYADDSSGTGFSLTAASKQFIAVLTTTNILNPPIVTDFAGLWFDRGTGGVATNVRSGSATLTLGSNTITFSSPLPSANYEIEIIDTAGIGVQQGAKTLNGFTCEALNAGTVGYIATMHI